MIRWIRAKKIIDGEIVGFWSKREDDEEEQYATLQQIYEHALRNHEDVKSGKMDVSEKNQYCIMQSDGVMVISIRKTDGKYIINNINGQNMQNALSKIPARED